MPDFEAPRGRRSSQQAQQKLRARTHRVEAPGADVAASPKSGDAKEKELESIALEGGRRDVDSAAGDFAQNVARADKMDAMDFPEVARVSGGGKWQVKGGKGMGRVLKDPFQLYMDEISRTEVLDHASVVALAGRIKERAKVEKAQDKLAKMTGDVRPTILQLAKELRMEPEEVQGKLNRGTVAKNDLVAANLRLVTSVAKKIQASKTGTAGLALDDMIQEGTFGLIRAAEKYDATRGYRFSTYATWWVRASVLRAITTQSRSIKVPSSVVEDFGRIQKERKRQVAAGAIVADDQAVADALGITLAKVRFVTGSVSRRVSSLDVTLGPAGSDLAAKSLVEVIAGEDDVEERMVEAMQRRELDAVLRRQLKPMERAAVRLRFGLEDGHPRTLVEVGKLLSISKERVRQHVFSALSKLNTPEVKEFLTDYLS